MLFAQLSSSKQAGIINILADINCITGVHQINELIEFKYLSDSA